jgi:hypothetical protein
VVEEDDDDEDTFIGGLDGADDDGMLPSALAIHEVSIDTEQMTSTIS